MRRRCLSRKVFGVHVIRTRQVRTLLRIARLAFTKTFLFVSVGSDSTYEQVQFLQPVLAFALATRDRLLETNFSTWPASRDERVHDALVPGSSVQAVEGDMRLAPHLETTMSYRSRMVRRSASWGVGGSTCPGRLPVSWRLTDRKTTRRNLVVLTPLIH